MNRLLLRSKVAAVTLLLIAGCGTSSRVEQGAVPDVSQNETAPTTDKGVVATAMPTSPTDTVSVGDSTSSVLPGDTVGALRVESGLLLMPVVTGFVAEPPRNSGPGIEGLDHRYVVFGDAKTGRRFVVGVGSGSAVKEALLSPELHGYQLLDGVRNGGSQVYLRTSGDPGKDAAASTEVAWAVSDHEVIAVAGQGMTLDELLEIARQIQVEVTK